ncbi:TaqI-like C-terminal specificity domain-containing protein [Dehalococcoides mccartyi]
MTSVYIERNSATSRFDSSDNWTILSPIEQGIKRKIEAAGIPLKEWKVNIYRGVLTGYNEAFIISGEKKDELIAADPKSAEIIRPILRGRDIKRYSYEFADLWLIDTHNGIRDKGIPPVNVDKYPAVKAHLDKFLTALEKRLDKGDTLYNLRSCAYTDDFSKQKIVWGEISDIPKFSLDQNGEFVMEATTFMMTGESLEFLLCFLNSRLSEYYFSKIGTTTGVGTVRWKKYKIETFHIPRLTYDEQIPFAMILNKILSQKQKSLDTATLDKDLDKMIYRLFDFSEEEIQTIEA